jgi:hypothetical protein
MFRRLVVVAAGGQAVEILTAGRGTTRCEEEDGSVSYWDGGISGDSRESVRVIGMIAAENGIEFRPGSNIGFLLGVYSLQVEAADRLVRCHWPAVIRVAEELLATKTVVGARVRQLVFVEDAPFDRRRAT